MTESPESLLERYIEEWMRTGRAMAVEELCPADPEKREALARLVREFHRVEATLSWDEGRASDPEPQPEPPKGFTLIEEIGQGAFGRVFKARDRNLNRTVAIKFVTRTLTATQWTGILREARFLAALDDAGIAKVFHVDREKGAIVLEYVEGFDLARIAATLDFHQSARIVLRLAEALDKAHRHRILHLDLKPANIRLDTALRPKILDFGLAQHLDERPHRWGSPLYAAPERFKERETFDPRTDLYSLGVVFYELLCGQPPFEEADPEALAIAVRQRPPRLPRELDPNIPAGLQAIVLKCLEKAPADRYQSASQLARDLVRFLEGRDVKAQSSYLTTGLAEKVEAHLGDLEDWERLGLVFRHERQRLTRGYQALLKPMEEWIAESRLLGFDQITLYLGVAVLFFGSVCLFYAHYFLKVTPGWAYPVFLLGGATFVLSGAAVSLQSAKTVAIAFDIAALTVLPLWLLGTLHALDWFSLLRPPDYRLFESGTFSNAQVQLAMAAVFFYGYFRARRSETSALASMAVIGGCLLFLSLLLNPGLKPWLVQGEYHRIALHLVPLLVILSVVGHYQERQGRPFRAKPCYLAGSILLVTILELLALNGKAFAFMGLSSTAPAGAEEAFDPVFFDTAVAMVINGMLVYWAAQGLARTASPLLRQQGSWLNQLSPFLMLEPLAVLVARDLYGVFYHWLYLVTSLAVLWLSGKLQRKGFYFAGMGNTVLALYAITHHYQWLETRFWPLTLMTAGAVLLTLGYRLYRKRVREAGDPGIRNG